MVMWMCGQSWKHTGYWRLMMWLVYGCYCLMMHNSGQWIIGNTLVNDGWEWLMMVTDGCWWLMLNSGRPCLNSEGKARTTPHFNLRPGNLAICNALVSDCHLLHLWCQRTLGGILKPNMIRRNPETNRIVFRTSWNRIVSDSSLSYSPP